VTDAIDLFCGAGGWGVAASALGLDVLGVEYWEPAADTHRAAGLPTLHADARSLDPLDEAFDAPGLIASPPCQTFSTAGNGGGRAQLDRIAEALRSSWWFPVDGEDERTALVLEPLRWILPRFHAGRPFEWIAFEQVPPCLPIWEGYAEALRALGYSVATGILNAEQYGVPQTRRRAILVAQLRGKASLPAPTHSRYYPRDPSRLDELLEPWVSMAEALGWIEGASVRSNYGTGGDPENRGERTGDEPAATVTEKVGRNLVFRSDNRPNCATRELDAPAPTVLANGERGTHQAWTYVASTMPNAARRPAPAPTIAFGRDSKGGMWSFAGAGQTAVDTAGQIPRESGLPAHAITGKGTAAWVNERPSPTVVGTRRSSEGAIVGRMVGRSSEDTERLGGHDGSVGLKSGQMPGVRVTVEEAAVLQSFPADYPWQGTKTQRYQQVGNAIPPLLALAVLRAVAPDRTEPL
jgi:DNA (cytosine-5)-methyltransferase 1